MNKKENIDIDLSLEEYYLLNEKAREKGMLLDDFIEEVLRKYFEGKINENIN